MLHFEKENPYTLFYKLISGNALSSFLIIQTKSNAAGKNVTELPMETEKLKFTIYTYK